jgi:hypothetical protein
MHRWKQLSLMATLLLIVGLLPSCQVTFVPVTPTASATPLSLSATATRTTPTPLPPTRTPFPPTWTPLPPTATPVPPTPTHTPPAVAIQVFTASPLEILPGESVTLTWQATGEWATLYRLDEAGRLTEPSYPVSLSGSMVITTHTTARNQAGFILYAGAGDVVEQAMISVALTCPDVWFFADGPDSCPLPVSSSAMAVEHFERGIMLWLEAAGEQRPYNEIVILYADEAFSPRWQMLVDYWVEGVPEEAPAIVAPEGLYEPVRGFGKVWRENSSVRDRLGWATEEEYLIGTGSFQCTAVSKYSTCYVTGPDGAIVVLEPEGSAWSVWGRPSSKS